MMRVMRDGQLEFSGHGGVAGRQQMHQRGRENHSQRAQRAHDDDQRRGHQIRQARGFFLAAVRQILGEDGDERARKRAFGEQIARQIGNAEAEHERVVDQPRAEQPRHHALAHQAR